MDMLVAVLGGLFILVLGGYGYTYRVDRRVMGLFLTLRDNHLRHLEKRIERLEHRASE